MNLDGDQREFTSADIDNIAMLVSCEVGWTWLANRESIIEVKQALPQRTCSSWGGAGARGGRGCRSVAAWRRQAPRPAQQLCPCTQSVCVCIYIKGTNAAPFSSCLSQSAWQEGHNSRCGSAQQDTYTMWRQLTEQLALRPSHHRHPQATKGPTCHSTPQSTTVSEHNWCGTTHWACVSLVSTTHEPGS